MTTAQSIVNAFAFDPVLVATAVLVACLFAIGVALGMALGRRAGMAEAERDFERKLPSERDDAVKRSRAVIGGLMAEQLAPWLPGFPFDPTEVRFIGKPVDFVAFPGASTGEVREVVLVEVKSGDAKLSGVERSLRAAIEAGAVRYVEYRAPSRRVNGI
ncbi:MAG: hypothetical protein NT080_03045 [Spirochaetes bacterium]|nr:hypothetical protein [Spirochaetota bacterium]